MRDDILFIGFSHIHDLSLLQLMDVCALDTATPSVHALLAATLDVHALLVATLDVRTLLAATSYVCDLLCCNSIFLCHSFLKLQMSAPFFATTSDVCALVVATSYVCALLAATPDVCALIYFKSICPRPSLIHLQEFHLHNFRLDIIFANRPKY
jgi:hypothetical protein